MKLTDIGMDQYDRRARLMPALLVLLPAALAVIALAPDSVVGWSGVVALVVQAGGSFLLAQIVGDIGKRKEGALFELFGGRPTERMLCHEHATNRYLLAERHRKLAKLFPRLKIPTADAETRDRRAALELYSACIDKVRAQARGDKERFPHVHRENVHYGFRRNLWALKPYGMAVTAVALAIVSADLAGMLLAHQQIRLAVPVIVGIDFLLLIGWAFAINTGWVERAARLYAERLLEVLDALGQ